MRKIKPEVESKVYSRDYFLSDRCEGFSEFSRHYGLSNLKAKLLRMLDLKENELLLDLGCGRGEFLFNAASYCKKVIGVDYSEDALCISREVLSGLGNASVVKGDCRRVPFKNNSFDKVVCGDVVEHLSFDAGVNLFEEIYRVIKPGGLAIIHTSPNALFVRFVFPMGRLLLRLINKKAAQKIEAKLCSAESVHICIHDFFSLRRLLKKAGIKGASVTIDPDILRGGNYIHTEGFSKNPLVKLFALAGSFFPIRLFIGNDLFVTIYKK